MCIPKESKSDYIYMINSSPEYKAWFKTRFETVDNLYSKLVKVEQKKYLESQQVAKGYAKVEGFVNDANKDLKIYELLSNICKDVAIKRKFIEALKKVQEHDRKGYAYDERLLRKYSYTYYKYIDLRTEIMSKLDKAQRGEKPREYKLSAFDKCYKSFDYLETGAKMIAEKDTSSINEFDFPGISKEEFEEKLKILKALAIMNSRYKRDIEMLEEEINDIERKLKYSLEDNAEMIKREIKYIKAALVDMMELGEKLRHTFSADGEFDVDFDL